MWRIESISNEPYPRCAHQADSIDEFLYVFGGWNDDNLMLNDIHRFNVETWEWEQITIDNNYITPRNGHSVTTVNKQLLVFGGGSFSGFLNDVLMFDPILLQWKTIEATGSIPSGRSKHSATLMGDRIYVFGGGDGIRLYNDTYYLDLATMNWVHVNIDNGRLIPSARWGHSMVPLSDCTILLFGGHSGTKRLNDLYIFNTETNEWSQPKLSVDSEETPQPRAGHSASMIGHHMVIFGGGDGHIINDFYGLDTREWRWWKIKSNTPEARCAHSSNIINNKLVIYGGGNGLQCLKKLLIFEKLDHLEELYQQYIKQYKPLKSTSLSISPTATTNSTPNKSSKTTTETPIKGIKSSSLPLLISNTILSSTSSSSQQTPLSTSPSRSTTTITTTTTTVHTEEKNKENNSTNNNTSLSPTIIDQLQNDLNSIKDSLSKLSTSIDNNSTNNNNNSNSKTNNIYIENNNNNNSIDKFKESCLTQYEKRDITFFLGNIGMSKYVTKFIEEEISTCVLYMLTEDHLKAIGVLSLGDRLSILKGIKESTLYLLKGLPPISIEFDPSQSPRIIDDDE
ncbi:hypothetical protein CYY_009352 [Polysphondylium violaceum]|uniref:SAM domain-containing protein n=1 Tax=Polysphondylium violaceum TaxID=133409 RepID=A0A8J4UPJ3_9MYCE|nr:hypothetical protein CYY_009352 [Polysphondylium violaceum]